jgi:hypothetical protein
MKNPWWARLAIFFGKEFLKKIWMAGDRGKMSPRWMEKDGWRR